MSCISRSGEFSEHKVNDEYVCTRCHVLDEDAIIEELHKVRNELATMKQVHASVHKAEIAEVVREIVDLATDPNGPSAEWLTLVRAVTEGHYTPPGERVR